MKAREALEQLGERAESEFVGGVNANDLVTQESQHSGKRSPKDNPLLSLIKDVWVSKEVALLTIEQIMDKVSTKNSK